MDENLIHKFGYAEMYEWEDPQKMKLGRFVQFSNADKIGLCDDPYCVIGVSSINRVIVSDNPEEWPYKHYCNEFLDTYIENKHLAKAQTCKGDDGFEFIKTYEHYESIPLVREEYDPSKMYVQRINRPEWQQVTILGKCIVEDDGTLESGMYCTIYDGDDPTKIGIAVKAHKHSNIKYYVISRISEKTCLILFK